MRSNLDQRPKSGFRELYRLRNLFAIALVFSVITQTGCVNLTAVRDFANVSSQTQQIQTAASILSDSPQRQAQYSLEPNAEAVYESSVLIGKTNQIAMVAAYGIIQNYMTTLATLADDSIVASNNAVSSFTQTLGNQHLIGDTNALAAYGKIANLVSHAMTDIYRREKVRKMIEEAEPSFTLAVSNLKHVVAVDCVIQLQAETNMLTSYYIVSTGLKRDDTPRWAKRLVFEIYNQKMRLLQNEISDCNQCALALGKIAAGYKAMYESRDHLSGKELATILKGDEQDISDAVGSIKQLK